MSRWKSVKDRRYSAVLNAPMGRKAYWEFKQRHKGRYPTLHELKGFRRSLVARQKRESLKGYVDYLMASQRYIDAVSGTYPIPRMVTYSQLYQRPFEAAAWACFYAREGRRPLYDELRHEIEVYGEDRCQPSVNLRTTQCLATRGGWTCTREKGHDGPCALVQPGQPGMALPPLSKPGVKLGGRGVVVGSPIIGRMSSTEPNIMLDGRRMMSMPLGRSGELYYIDDMSTKWSRLINHTAKLEQKVHQQLLDKLIAKEEDSFMRPDTTKPEQSNPVAPYPVINDQRQLNGPVMSFKDVPNGAIIEHTGSHAIGLKSNAGISWLNYGNGTGGFTEARNISGYPLYRILNVTITINNR